MQQTEQQPNIVNGQATQAGIFSRTPGDYDSNTTLHQLVSIEAGLRPDAIAVQFDDAHITYGELDRQSSLLAAQLMRRGVRKGDIVGLFLPRALTTVIAKLAILKAGAAYAPFDPAYPADHLNYMIEDCAPRLILVDETSRETIGLMPIAESTIFDLDEAWQGLEPSGEVPEHTPCISGGDAAYVMYTSGSTGRPKGVIIPHRGIIRLVRAQNYVRFSRNDVVLHTATISFDAATFEIWGALLNGGRLVGIGDHTLSMPRIVQVIEDNRVSVMLLTTALFHLLVDHQGGSLSSLRHVLFGGEVASAEHARRFLMAHPHCTLTNAYGPTEVTVMASAYAIPPDFAGEEIPIGQAIAHGRVHILDENLEELPPGAEGQLAVSGDGLAIGYLNRPELTAEKFVTITTRADGPTRCYLTGDLAVMDADGLLHFRGRRDRQIKIDGKRIELDEIEAALRRDERLADVVVLCRQNGAAAKRIVAYLRPREASKEREGTFAQSVLAKLRTILPGHMIPGSAVVLEHFPMNRAGKVDRSKLPVPETTMPAAAGTAAGVTEEMVTALWKQVLGVAGIGPDQNFFDLGGTSMQLMRIHVLLEKELQREIEVVALFQHPNICSLARFLDSKTTATAVPASAAQSRAQMQKRMMSQFRRSPR